MRNLQESCSFRWAMETRTGDRRRRIGPFALVLLILWVLFSATVPAQETGTPCPGDVNLDGKRASGDLAFLSAHLAGERVLEDEALANADVNLDRIVDVGDVTRLLEHTTGEFPLIPCGEFDPVEIACPGLLISPSSAQPLENVSLGSLPDELAEPILALVTEEGKEAGILAFVDRLGDGTATLSVPFYPGGTLEGGPVNVRVTDGFSACAPASFSIDAIPPAPGEFSRVADALQESVDARAEDLGLAADELISIDGEVPSYVIPLAIAQRLLDHPENPDSLRAMSEGTAPFLEGDTDNTVLDGVAAWLNLADLFGVAGRSGAAPVQADGSPLACRQSVGDLDKCMRVAAADVLSRPNQEGTLSLYAMKLFPGGSESAAKAVFDKISAATELGIATQGIASQAANNLLPSRFASFEVEANPESLEEDSIQEGKWTAKLTAVSQGWKFQESRSELLKQLGRSQLSAPAMKAVGLAEKFFPGRGAKLGNKLGRLIGTNAGEVAPDAREDDTTFEIPPETFGPLSDGLNEAEWTRVEIRGRGVQQVGHKKYTAAGASDLTGPTQIAVEVRTDEGRFGGVEPIEARAGVEVLPIELTISPSAIELEPGEQEAIFTVEVENAAFPSEVEVEATSPLSADPDIEYLGGNSHRVTYTAPAFPPEDFSDRVIVRYSGETGAFRDGPEFTSIPRTAEAEVTIGEALDILVSGPGCVEPGSRDNRYSAEVRGPDNQPVDNQQVTWSSSSGRMRSNGTFLAPESPEADVLITATSVEDSQVQGQTVVKVGGCSCWWTVEIIGSTERDEDESFIPGRPGVDYGSFFHVGEEVFVELHREPDDGNLGFRYAPDEGGWWGGGRMPSDAPTFDNDEPFASVFVENSDNAVAVEIFGPAEENFVIGDLVERRPILVRVKFRIENDPDYWRNGCIVDDVNE